MGARGPTPKPTILRVVEGQGKSKDAAKNEAQPALRMPTPPAEVIAHKDALAEWKRIGPELYRLGLISELDRAVFSQYCLAWARLQEAERAIQAEALADARRRGKRKVNSAGLMILTSNGNLIQNPAVGIANVAASNVLRYARELGLTPSARTRIEARPTETTSEDDVFD